MAKFTNLQLLCAFSAIALIYYVFFSNNTPKDTFQEVDDMNRIPVPVNPIAIPREVIPERSKLYPELPSYDPPAYHQSDTNFSQPLKHSGDSFVQTGYRRSNSRGSRENLLQAPASTGNNALYSSNPVGFDQKSSHLSSVKQNKEISDDSDDEPYVDAKTSFSSSDDSDPKPPKNDGRKSPVREASLLGERRYSENESGRVTPPRRNSRTN